MTLPAIQDLCDALDFFDGELCLTFPGGAQLCAQPVGLPPSLLELAKQLMAQANSAMAPLAPIFDIIEAIAAIQQCIEGVVDALSSVPPDPTKITACVPALSEKIAQLLKLLPVLSIPALLVGFLDLLIFMIDGVIFDLQALIALLNRISASELIAPRAPGLLAALDCAKATVDNQMSNIERAFASINAIIDLVNTLGGLAGLPEVPKLDGLVGDDPAGAVDALEGIKGTLQTLRDSIPVPI